MRRWVWHLGVLLLVVAGAAVMVHPTLRAAAGETARAALRLAQTGSTAPHWVQQRERRLADFAASTQQADIVVLGDSLTAQGDWAAIAPQRTVLNRGIGGEDTADLLARLDTVLRAEPRVVIIFRAHGDLEDDGGHLGVPAARISQSAQTLAHLFERLQAAGIQPVLVDVPPIGAQVGASGSFNAHIRALNTAHAEVAAQARVPVLSAFSLLEQNGRLAAEYTTDGTHLTPEAYAVLTPALRAVVQRRFGPPDTP